MPALRHDGPVQSGAFSPNGRRAVTASTDKTARVWDAAAGQPATPPPQHEGTVWSAAFGPNGRRVATAGADLTARVWDVVPGDRAAGNLTVLAEPLACQRLDATDGVFPLTAGEWRARWDDLRKKYPADFRPPRLGCTQRWACRPRNPPPGETTSHPAGGGDRKLAASCSAAAGRQVFSPASDLPGYRLVVNLAGEPVGRCLIHTPRTYQDGGERLRRIAQNHAAPAST